MFCRLQSWRSFLSPRFLGNASRPLVPLHIAWPLARMGFSQSPEEWLNNHLTTRLFTDASESLRIKCLRSYKKDPVKFQCFDLLADNHFCQSVGIPSQMWCKVYIISDRYIISKSFALALAHTTSLGANSPGETPLIRFFRGSFVSNLVRERKTVIFDVHNLANFWLPGDRRDELRNIQKAICLQHTFGPGPSIQKNTWWFKFDGLISAQFYPGFQTSWRFVFRNQKPIMQQRKEGRANWPGQPCLGETCHAWPARTATEEAGLLKPSLSNREVKCESKDWSNGLWCNQFRWYCWCHVLSWENVLENAKK